MTSWEKTGDDRKVIDSGDRFFPAENSNVGRTIGTDRLLDSVCVQARLSRTGFLVLGLRSACWTTFLTWVTTLYLRLRSPA